MVNKIEEYTEEEVNNYFSVLISQNKYKRVSSQKNPKAFVLGGLAGSGKSNFIAKLENTYAIIGDDYRHKHPRFTEIVKQYGNDWVFKTNDFAIAMIKKLTEQAIKDKKNIVIEGTFRTYEAPANTLKQLKDSGYETHAHVVLCHKDVAKASTIERFYEMKKAGLPARMVTDEKFQEMLDGLANNADRIKDSGLAKTLTMSARRNLNQLVMVYKSDNQKKPSEIINDEMTRELTSQEKNFIKEVNKFHELRQFLEKSLRNKEICSEKEKDRELER